MIDLYYWPTPNGQKIAMFAEEAGLDYRIKPVNLGEGDQFDPEYLKISPNNKMPAMVDHQPLGGGEPLSLFESGAILQYLAEKTGRFCPTEPKLRYPVLAWVYWQVGGLGPMGGQNHHFHSAAPETIPYAIDRFVKEMRRLYGVLDTRLEGRRFIAGDDYTIADMATYPWALPQEDQGTSHEDFPHLKAWFLRVAERSATRRADALGERIKREAGG